MPELFDAYGTSYGAAVQSSIDFSGLPHSFFMQAKAELLRALIDERLSGRDKPAMLDVGCGVGTFHPYVRGLVRRLRGIDVSGESIARARSANPGVEYDVFDGRTFPGGEAGFDLVTAICVLHHVPPAGWGNFVREMRRAARPGALVCVIEHNPFNPLTRLAVARCEFDRDAVLLRATQARDLLVQAGLRDVEARYFLLMPWATDLLRRVESAFRRLPLGAQYVAFGTA
jgi:SAM-dependent methyltransferase